MANEPSKPIQFSRLDAVRNQLEMAVRARLQFEDLVSAMTLAGAAERVLSDLHPKDAKFSDDTLSIRAFCNTYVKTDCRKQAAEYMRAAYDFLRHADKTPDRVLELDAEWVDLTLMMAIRAFESTSKARLPVLIAFRTWAAITDPKWEVADHIPEINDPALVEWSMKLTTPELFNAILAHYESKSLIANPKSLTGRSQP